MIINPNKYTILARSANGVPTTLELIDRVLMFYNQKSHDFYLKVTKFFTCSL